MRNAIIFTKNLTKYGGAFYQQDVMLELEKKFNVFFYGPDYDVFCKEDTLDSVLAKCPFRPEVIFIGHSWVKDNVTEKGLTCADSIDFSRTDIYKILFLNKEYARLEQKLAFIKASRINHVFTHHHEVEKYQKITGVPCTFWPFAASRKLFDVDDFSDVDNDIDFFFSGILRNPSFPEKQRDTRVRIMREIFYHYKDLPLRKKRKYRNRNIFWSNYLFSKSALKINRLFDIMPFRIPAGEYQRFLARSKICLNTLSPLDLIGTRFYESMAMKSLVFCEWNPVYDNMFTDGVNCVMFKNDLSDFDDKMNYYLNNWNEAERIIATAYEDFINKHTWEKRIDDLMRLVGI